MSDRTLGCFLWIRLSQKLHKSHQSWTTAILVDKLTWNGENPKGVPTPPDKEQKMGWRSVGGFEGKKEKGENDAILFYLKMYLYTKI